MTHMLKRTLAGFRVMSLFWRSRIIFFSCVFLTAFALPAFAQSSPTTPTPGFGLLNPLGVRTVPGIIGSVVSWLGGFAGSLFFFFLLWGGVEWMTAGGDAGKVKKAQGRIVASVAGILVVILSYIAVATIIGIVPK